MSVESGDREKLVVAEAVRNFYAVREVPFYLGLRTDPARLFLSGRGDCGSKHLYLADQLLKLGYQVELGVAGFSWADLPIPKLITDLLADPLDSHLFLYVKREEKEMILDATWDKGMPEGFPINDWDGINGTPIGVPYRTLGRQAYFPLRMRVMLRSQLPQLPRPTPFNDAFNRWLGRKKS